MNENKVRLGVVLLGLGLCLWQAPAARADFEACGGVFFSGDAKCEYREKEQCMTECKTEAVQTACTAKLYTSCENSCTATASTSCESSCGQVCTSDCTQQVAAPEPPNCMGLCVSDCKKSCEGGDGRRRACCSHTCNDRCEDKCKSDPPPVTMPAQCTETCTNACSGSCTAQANVTCQVDCQTTTFTECEVELVETCETKCMDEGGAIFCDGQFVNAANSRSCADELKAKLNFDIDFEGAGSAIVEGTEDAIDEGKEKSDELCTVSRVGGSRTGGTGALVLLGLCASALGVQRARKRRNQR